MEKAYFAAGCFWGVEKLFNDHATLISSSVGYGNGTTINPTYQDVCTGKTGHAEMVELEFDPNVTTYEKLVNMLFDMHDPTTLNRQGNDIGTQYRSGVYYLNEEQKNIAEKVKSEKQKWFSNPIVTEIVPLSVYYKAEEYHQKYLIKNPQGYMCHHYCPRL